MVRILERSLFYTQPAPEPSQPPQPTVQHIAPPRLPRRQKPERTIWASQLMKPNVSRYTETVEEPEEYVVYEVGLDEGTLAQLEELARRYGLELPEELKEKQVVEPDRLDEARALIQQKLDEFTSKLREAIQDANEAAFEQQLMSISMETGRPVPDIVTKDNKVPVWTKPVIKPVPIGVTKEDEEKGKEILKQAQVGSEDEDELPGWGTHPLNQIAGYNLYYQGRYAMLEALNLMDKSSQVEHRIHGASGRVSYDELMKEAEEISNPTDILIEHRTMTFSELQKNAEAMRNVETLSGKIFEKLNLEPEEYDEGSKLGWAVEETMKDVARGAIGLFTFPVDVVMLLAQSDEFALKDVKQSLKESIYSGRFFGEMAGSILASAGLSALWKSAQPTVYEQPGGLTGYRQIMHEIKIDGDDIARAMKTEAFDYDELMRMTIKKKYRLFGPKEITIERIPQKFTATSYESLMAGDNLMTTTRILEVPLGPDDSASALRVGKVKISQMASFGDDAARFAETSTWTEVSVDDIMNFLKKAQEGGKGPTELIKIVGYSTDDATRTIITKEIYDDITKTNVEIKSFRPETVLDDVIKVSKKASETLDDVTKLTSTADDVSKLQPTSSSSPRGNLMLALDKAMKEAQELSYKITQKSGERILLPTKDIVVPPVKSIDINKEVNETINILDVTESQKGGKKTQQGGKERQVTDGGVRIEYEISQLMQEVVAVSNSVDVGISIVEVPQVRTRTRVETRVKTETRLEFDVSEVYDEMQKFDQELRQLLAEAVAVEEVPAPRSQRVKIKEAPPKKMKVKEKKPPSKRKTRRKKAKEKEFDWEEWVGYEDLFEF